MLTYRHEVHNKDLFIYLFRYFFVFFEVFMIYTLSQNDQTSTRIKISRTNVVVLFKTHWKYCAHCYYLLYCVWNLWCTGEYYALFYSLEFQVLYSPWE